MILLLWIVLPIWFIVSFLGALRENEWKILAPIFEAGFFWFCFLIGPFLLLFPEQNNSKQT